MQNPGDWFLQVLESHENSILLSVHTLSIAVARHALIQRSKGQKSRSHGYESCHGCSWNALLLLVWDCTSY